MLRFLVNCFTNYGHLLLTLTVHSTSLGQFNQSLRDTQSLYLRQIPANNLMFNGAFLTKVVQIKRMDDLLDCNNVI